MCFYMDSYSGVSWVVEGPHRTIRTIVNWPHLAESNANSEKVPSVIYYENGKVKSWGYRVGPKLVACRWMKVLLEKNDASNTWRKYQDADRVKQTDQLLRDLGKTAEDVVSDFLRELWEFSKEDIRKYEPDWETIYDLHVVITVPAVWSDSAKGKTLKAAERAGLGKKAHITRVSEPEAAAVATLRLKGEQNAIAVRAPDQLMSPVAYIH